MFLSEGDAVLMLLKWLEENHPLKLMLAGDGFRIPYCQAARRDKSYVWKSARLTASRPPPATLVD